MCRSLIALYDADHLAFFGSMAHLAERLAFLRKRKKRWVVYAKPPFAWKQCSPRPSFLSGSGGRARKGDRL